MNLYIYQLIKSILFSLIDAELFLKCKILADIR
ncbi:Uncharacterised protein [Yersinia kristensenii]|uniref:Uncharacterized protein n=1 Tax=Yersinia kristensenii TaxID=28152 RepID=A0A0T9KYI6_YERKR|nr:Uncharacterised protein [Yersinia kristensenii]CND92354.1 Uncharacterised protein [Yersinia kristensenii]CNE41223.1 Uncharacterised protein [Yersinia kristensenii]CNK60687.1 Uncharacterised protein [Yersinia kristensenii]